MDKAKILRLCNEIEMVIDTVCNTGYTLQQCDIEAIYKRTKAIAAEISEPPKTNGDRIRQMTDEQLAEYLRCKSCICQNEPDCEHTDCRAGILEWLRQEVGENDKA